MTAPVIGLGRVISNVTPNLCAITSRSGGSFHTACNMRWTEKESPDDPDPMRWTFLVWDWSVKPFAVLDMDGSPLCRVCAKYALERHAGELSPFVRMRLEAAVEPATTGGGK